MASGRMDISHGKRNVLQIARRVSATIGSDFFHAIAKHLASALAADCVYVGEFASGQMERVKTLAAFAGDESFSVEYPLADSASAQIALGKPVLCRAEARQRFPLDQALARLHAEAFAGVPLTTSEGTAAGVLMAVYRRSVGSLRDAKSILEIFAPRAAAELERKQDEERLRESEQRYRAFVALNADAMWRIEFEKPISIALPEDEQIDQIYRYGYLAECNDALARLFGLEKAAQLTGWRISDLAPISNVSVREAALHAIRSGYRFNTVEATPEARDGSRRHIMRSQWGIVENGMLVRAWGTSRDITELKTMERELNASEQRLTDLVETLNLLMVMLNENGTIAYCNKQLYRLTGWTPEETIGKDWFDLMVPLEDRAKARTAFESGKLPSEAPTHYESTLLGPQGTRWWVAWDSTSLRDADGKIVVSANVGRDISEYKMLEAQYRQAQQLESIGRLAGGVAHDFNNLLAVITGYSSVLLEKTEPSDPAYAGLIAISEAAAKGADLTHRLLAFSRREVPRPEQLNLTALIAADEEMVRRLIGDDIRLITRLDPAVDPVRADAGQIRQVLLNLIVNARDAMPQGGTLIIATLNRELSHTDAHFLAAPPGKYVELVVADTGIGITEEVRSHLFEPFYTTKEQGKGTGLGLSTVYGIIHHHGGHIGVESQPGRGARFRILLPALPTENAPEASEQSRDRIGR